MNRLLTLVTSVIFSTAGLLLTAMLLFGTSVHAEGEAREAPRARRGLVTSSNCPLSCRDIGLSNENCRQWTSGMKCYVEDYTQVPGHRSMVRVKKEQFLAPAAKKQSPRSALNRRGLITSSSCPYNCRDAGLSKDICREWRAGDKCYTEDYTQVPGHRTMIRIAQ